MKSKMSINEIANSAYKNAVSKGFYETPPSIPERLCLIHSEVSEALEADRKGHYCAADDITWQTLENSPTDQDFKELFVELVKSSFEDELADIMIRVMDLAASMNINLDAHIATKMRYNSLRPHMHGKKY